MQHGISIGYGTESHCIKPKCCPSFYDCGSNISMNAIKYYIVYFSHRFYTSFKWAKEWITSGSGSQDGESGDVLCLRTRAGCP